MQLSVKRVNYYYTTVEDKHGKGYWLLELFRQRGINLLAFTAFPQGAGRSQLDFVTNDAEKLKTVAAEAEISLVGPKGAFLVQGDDEVGAIVEMHYKLSTAGINVLASNGVTNGAGSFGYLFWVRPEDYEAATTALGI